MDLRLEKLFCQLLNPRICNYEGIVKLFWHKKSGPSALVNKEKFLATRPNHFAPIITIETTLSRKRKSATKIMIPKPPKIVKITSFLRESQKCKFCID